MSQMWTHRQTDTQTEKDVNPIVDTRLDSQLTFYTEQPFCFQTPITLSIMAKPGAIDKLQV